MINVVKIPKITTLDGYMIPIYREWDIETNHEHIPKMVYITTVNPFVKKSIILHEKRVAYMTCIQGSVTLETMINGKIEVYTMNSCDDVNNLLIIQPNIPILITNNEDCVSIIVNCPSPAWHPDDQDTIKFENWNDYSTWKKD